MLGRVNALPGRVSLARAGKLAVAGTPIASSYLATQAAALAANSWVELTGMGGLTWALIKSPTGEEQSILDFGNKGCRNAVGKAVSFVGGAHPGSVDFINYDEASNNWAKGTKPFTADTIHAWDNETTDPATGDVYYYQKTTGNFWVKTYATGLWSQIASNSGIAAKETIGLCWDPVRGGLVCFTDATGADLWTKSNNTWSNLKSIGSFSGIGGSFDMTAHYVTGTGDIWLGDGNNSPNQFWKLTPAGVLTKQGASPIPIECAGSAGNMSVNDSNSGKIAVINPRVGANQIRLWSAAPDSWATMSPSNGAITLNDASPISGFVTDIFDYGVLLFIVGTSTGNAPRALLLRT